jgi:hypothetical protein
MGREIETGKWHDKILLPGPRIPAASGQALRHATTVAYNKILVKQKIRRGRKWAAPAGEHLPGA